MGKYDAILNEVSTKASRLPTLLEEIKTVIAKGATSKEELAELSGRYNQEKTRREEAEAAEAKASAGLAEITTKYEAADLAAGNAAKELEKLQANLNSLSEKYTALDNEGKTLKEQNTGLEAKLDTILKELVARDMVIGEQENAIVQLKNYVDQYHNAIENATEEFHKSTKQK